MHQLYESLLKEKEYLSGLQATVKASLDEAPKGRIRISHRGSITQYYYKAEENKEKLPQGKYVRKNEMQLVKDIAQKDYDASILKCSGERIKVIDKLLELYKVDEIEAAYEKLNPYRKEIVTPRVLSEQEYMKHWKEKEFRGKPFEEGMVVINSIRGERVRSKSEKIIADMLEQREVPYRYEAPLYLRGLGTIYPDFTVLNIKRRKEIYWEHLGMMDNKEYCENALRRIEGYQRNGILLGDGLIITYETMKYPLETESIERNIREYCK